MTNVSEVEQKGALAKKASFDLSLCSTLDKNTALGKIAEQILKDSEYIISENKKDLESGAKKGLSQALLDRVKLNEDRIQGIVGGIQQTIKLPDPIGEVLETIERDNGLYIEKRRVPIGVVGMIYEARPNVTVDAATLSLKTGNAVILRGSSSAKYSNMAIVKSIHKALGNSQLPVDSVQLIEDTSRETAKELFHLNDYLDVLIPRGGKNLIDTVVKESTVPVIETGAGNCHVYIDDSADVDMATNIVLNSKMHRPSVCNAAESLLVEDSWFDKHGKDLIEKLRSETIELYTDKDIHDEFPETKEATEEDFRKEYLDLAMSVKKVADVNEAIDHINEYGTGHSESIVTADDKHAQAFMQGIDSTAVYHNASTRFTDGEEFGYGAEIGISTQKLHARGPMGLPVLTSNKFFIKGSGQIRE